MDEFSETPSGELSISRFKNVWLEESSDPPVFKNSLKLEPIVSEKNYNIIDQKEFESDYKDIKNEVKDIIKNNGEDDDLSILDDDEIDNVLLNEGEIKAKTEAWMKENGEFLILDEGKNLNNSFII